ncbi:DUF7224 domain-containing protein [Streptomyces sp. SP18CS02]|uniref:DUF7224 domain-containing protein n=1 Tax=Streptomyces sp. SP18CS02 TaxID=3002531 RepID=UPI002E77C38D|nr:hypothetical protein [Streptomyces sp. SP18CS02]MEE1751203.1 hypothetical protein [Streptomyces sp. SP18CS02]
MRLRTLLRSSAAAYLTPVLVVFILVGMSDVAHWTTRGYWPSVTGNSTYSLPFLLTGCAGLAAWEGARLTRGRVFTQPAVRSPLVITGYILLPVLVAGVIAMLAALFLSASGAGAGLGLPDFRMLGVELLLLLANILAGYLVGRRWPAAFSVPLVLVGAFFVSAYPRSWSIMWIRNLVGSGMAECCSIDQVIDPRTLWSAAAFATGLVLACVLVIVFRTSKAAVAGSLALIVAGTVMGAHFARDLGASPVQGRPDEELSCQASGRFRVCLWPEVRNQAMIRSEAAGIAGRLSAAGVPMHETFTMSLRPEASEAKLGIAPDARPDEVSAGVVTGVLPSPPACVAEGRYPGGEAEAPLAAWLLLTSGSAVETARAMAGSEAAGMAEKVRQLPQSVQLDWYKRNAEAMRSCSMRPQLIPVTGAK